MILAIDIGNTNVAFGIAEETIDDLYGKTAA